MTSTRITWHIHAAPAEVYRALVDAASVAQWMVPDGMTSQVHAFDPIEGGAFRISLTHADGAGTGKTNAHTDTFHGRFTQLIENRQVVQVVAFETEDPAMRGDMTISYRLAHAQGGTDLLATHEDLPAGLAPADNEAGWRMSLGRLARLVEAR